MPKTLDQRERDFLGLIVRDYIATAEPVGSETLRKKYDLPLSPATIRHTMMALEEAGLLEQPYTSAGRVPTEAGYRYYIEHCTLPKNVEGDVQDLAHFFRGWAADESAPIKRAARQLAEHLQEGVFLGIGRRETYYTGLSYLFGQPEFESHDIVVEIGRVLDALDEVVARLSQETLEMTVLIGRENPFDASCATVVAPRLTSQGERVIIGVIGPMRMDYDRIIPILKSFSEHV